MYRTILVPLDGSPLSERALPVAENLARATGAGLVLTQSVWITGDAETQAKAVENAEAYLSRLAERIKDAGLDVQVAVPFDRPAEGILTEVDLRKADLVVMSTHGRSGLSRLVYGSVAEAVLQRSPKPVMLVREGEHLGAVLDPNNRPEILVPLDGSSFAEAALPVATELAGVYHSAITLVRATGSVTPNPGAELGVPLVIPLEELEAAKEEARNYMADLRKQIEGRGHVVRVVVEEGQAADVILEQVRRSANTLIVMATHGRSGLSRLVMGSIAVDVLRRATVPLLLIRPAGLNDGEMSDSSSSELTGPTSGPA